MKFVNMVAIATVTVTNTRAKHYDAIFNETIRASCTDVNNTEQDKLMNTMSEY